jgi:hypothetical protein
MKSQTNSKEIGVKSSSREESRKSSVGLVNTFIKKFNRTNPITINSKTLFLNSQRGSRPEVKPIKMPNQSVPVSTNHSRYAYSQIASKVSTAQLRLSSPDALIRIQKRAEKPPSRNKDSTIAVTPLFPKNLPRI